MEFKNKFELGQPVWVIALRDESYGGIISNMNWHPQTEVDRLLNYNLVLKRSVVSSIVYRTWDGSDSIFTEMKHENEKTKYNIQVQDSFCFEYINDLYENEIYASEEEAEEIFKKKKEAFDGMRDTAKKFFEYEQQFHKIEIPQTRLI